MVMTSVPHKLHSCAFYTLTSFSALPQVVYVHVTSFWLIEYGNKIPFTATVPSAKTVDFPLLHFLANISVMQ